MFVFPTDQFYAGMLWLLPSRYGFNSQSGWMFQILNSFPERLDSLFPTSFSGRWDIWWKRFFLNKNRLDDLQNQPMQGGQSLPLYHFKQFLHKTIFSNSIGIEPTTYNLNILNLNDSTTTHRERLMKQHGSEKKTYK